MAKYSGLNSLGKIEDFVSKSDVEAVYIARTNNFKCLMKVRSFAKSSPIATLLPWKEEGHK